MGDNEPEFRKSRRSGNGNNCVEVATNLASRQGVVLVRDSKDPDGPALQIHAAVWQTFVQFAQNLPDL